MLVPDRRERVLERVRRAGSAEVDTLASELAVSRSTIRRDLTELEQQGALRRTRGGAYVGRSHSSSASRTGDAIKSRLGAAAADLVPDGATVMITAGSTTTAMVPHLAHRGLTVVTNGLDIAHRLAHYDDVSVVLLGGVLHDDRMTLVGPMSGQNMADLHVDLIVAGAFGIDVDVGITGAKIDQAGYHHDALDHTDALVVVADGTKFGRRGPTVLAPLAQVDHIVTDDTAPSDLIDRVRQYVRVTVVETEPAR